MLAGMASQFNQHTFGQPLPARALELKPIWRAAQQAMRSSAEPPTAEASLALSEGEPPRNVTMQGLPTSVREAVRALYSLAKSGSTPASASAGVSEAAFCAMCKQAQLVSAGQVTLPQVLQCFRAGAGSDPAADTSGLLAPGPSLTLAAFLVALAALADALHAGVPTSVALERLCAKMLAVCGAPSGASNSAQSAAARLGLSTAEVEHCHPSEVVRLLDAYAEPGCLAILSAQTHRRWLRRLFRLYAGPRSGTQQLETANSASAACDSIEAAQVLAALKDLALVPRAVPAAQVLASCAAAAAIGRAAFASGTVPRQAAGGCLHFEQFLDALALCAQVAQLPVGGTAPCTSGPMGENQAGVAFADSYSTDAKRFWVQEVEVRYVRTTLSSLGCLYVDMAPGFLRKKYTPCWR